MKDYIYRRPLSWVWHDKAVSFSTSTAFRASHILGPMAVTAHNLDGPDHLKFFLGVSVGLATYIGACTGMLAGRATGYFSGMMMDHYKYGDTPIPINERHHYPDYSGRMALAGLVLGWAVGSTGAGSYMYDGVQHNHLLQQYQNGELSQVRPAEERPERALAEPPLQISATQQGTLPGENPRHGRAAMWPT